MSVSRNKKRIEVLEYSIKTTTSLATKIHLESELNELKSKIKNHGNTKF